MTSEQNLDTIITQLSCRFEKSSCFWFNSLSKCQNLHVILRVLLNFDGLRERDLYECPQFPGKPYLSFQTIQKLHDYGGAIHP